MTLAGLLVFCVTYVLAVAAPGPGVAALVARVLGRGTQRIVPFIAGFVAGDLTLFTIAAGGLSVLAQTMGEVFLVIRYLGAAYLLYLAWRLWTTPPAAAEAEDPGYQSTAAPEESGPRLFLTGLTVTLGNPKAILFFMALLPTVVDLSRLAPAEGLLLAACIAVLMSLVLGSYAFATTRVRRLLRSARSLRLLNRATGTVMAGAAVAIAAR